MARAGVLSTPSQIIICDAHHTPQLQPHTYTSYFPYAPPPATTNLRNTRQEKANLIPHEFTSTMATYFDKFQLFRRAVPCPNCRVSLEGQTANDLSFTHIQNQVVSIVHATCRSKKIPGKVVACLQCLKFNKNQSQLTRRCTCNRAPTTGITATSVITTTTPSVTAPLPSSSASPIHSPTAENIDFGSNENVGIGYESELPACEHEQISSSDNNSIEMERKVQEGFDDLNMWSRASSNFFRREHKQKGEGRKGLIYNSLVDKHAASEFQMNPTELNYHYHLTSMFNDISQSASHDVTSMSCHIVKEGVEEKKAENELYRKCLSESCHEVFADLAATKGCDIDTMIDEVNKRTDEKNKERQNKIPRSETDHPTNYNTVRKKYTEGANSVLMTLPIPEVGELDGFGYIPLEKILNHILALGTDMLTFEKDEDYTDCKGNYEGTYFQDLHQTVKEANHPSNTKVHVLRIWSDAFQAHQIKADSEHNSMQLFTITVLPPKGCSWKGKKHLTFPFALGFKKKDHSVILDRLLKEIESMKIVKERYCGIAKCMVPTAFYFQTCSNDYPERCANSVTAQLGKYTHRFGYSCLFDPTTTPSCTTCEQKRIATIMQTTNETANTSQYCNKCTDWWSNEQVLEHYPVEPGEKDVKPVPLIKLSFQLLTKAVYQVAGYKELTSKPTKTSAHSHLSKNGVAKTFATYIIDCIWGNRVNTLNYIESLPSIWRKHNLYGVDVKDFAPAPMHMCSLGVEKSLIPQTTKMFNKNNKIENTIWKGMTSKIYKYHATVNALSLDWCMVMPFSSKDKAKLGTATWQSEHYLAFTRMSLVHFAQLEHIPMVMGKEEKRLKIFKAFKRVRVLWLCLMSRMFGDIQVPSEEVDNYVKLFLSSCNSFENASKDLKHWDDKDKEDNKKSKKRKRKSINKDQTDVENDTQMNNAENNDEQNNEFEAGKKERGPFFTTGSNYLSLLNVKDAIDRYGSMRELWEGYMESYIQNVKCELTTMRHNYTFMQTILKKMLRASCLEEINEDNPFSQNKRYGRLLNCKVYPANAFVGQCMFDCDNAISGVIIDQHMYVCFNTAGRTNENITLHRIDFDHSIGMWRYNLWYSAPKISDQGDSRNLSCIDRVDLVDQASDYFVLAPLLSLADVDTNNFLFEHNRWAFTVICRSWRVMVSTGKLELIVPQKDLFS